MRREGMPMLRSVMLRGSNADAEGYQVIMPIT
jgi:hypothetical protein